MTAPSVAASGTISVGTGATRAPGIPGTPEDNDLIIMPYAVASSVPNPAVPNFILKFDGDDSNPGLGLYFKRLFGTEPEGATSYSITTGTTLGQTSAQAFLIDGAKLGTDPFFESVSTARGSSSTSSPAVSLDNVPEDSLLLWIDALGAARTNTPPAGFTRLTSAVSSNVHAAVKVHGGGDTGSIVGTIASNATHKTALLAILPAPDVSGADGNVIIDGAKLPAIGKMNLNGLTAVEFTTSIVIDGAKLPPM